MLQPHPTDQLLLPCRDTAILRKFSIDSLAMSFRHLEDFVGSAQGESQRSEAFAAISCPRGLPRSCERLLATI